MILDPGYTMTLNDS